MNLIKSILSMALIFAAAGAAHAQTSPLRVPALFNKIYAPGGFDSNDNVQIVGEGRFRNTCYRRADTSVTVDEANHQIHVGPYAYEYSGFCLQVVLPFDRVMDVGVLSPGVWQIVQDGDSSKLGELAVHPARIAEADDFLYAPISQAFFRQKGLGAEVMLSGDFPNSCFNLDRVQVTLEKDVIVLQPIATFNKRTTCTDGKFPFSKLVSIDLVPKGRYLLHVRAMNGNSVNSLVDMN